MLKYFSYDLNFAILKVIRYYKLHIVNCTVLDVPCGGMEASSVKP
jgi:hypothetical protein